MQQFRILRALGLSFRAWFRNFVPFTLLAALLYAPVIIWISLLDPSKARDVDELLKNLYVRPVYAIVGLSALLSPMLTYRVVQDLNGTRVSMFTSIKYGVRGFLPAIGLAIATNVVQLLPGGGILGAIFTCVWFVAAPAAVAERLGPHAAFTRGGELTRGRRWGIFGLTFLIGLILVGLLFAWIIPMLKDDVGDAMTHLRRSALYFMILMAVFQTFTGIVQAVSYALLRQDKDGVSYEELAKVFE